MGACAAALTGEEAGVRFAHQTQCQEAITAYERSGGYEVHGCGKHAFCGRGGFCTPFLTAEEAEQARQARIVAARQSFMEGFGCTISETTLVPQGSDFIAEGCGRYARCSGTSAMICVAEMKPTCQSLARVRYDQCTIGAAQQGAQARKWRFAPWQMNVANSIVGSIQANKASSQCAAAYQMELDVCARGQGG